LWSPRYNSHRPVARKKRPRLDSRCFRLLCSPILHPHTGAGLTATLAAAHTDVAGSAPPRLGPRPASTPSALGESLHPERRRRRPPSRCPAAIRTSPQSAPCTGPRAPPGPLPVSLNNEQADWPAGSALHSSVSGLETQSQSFAAHASPALQTTAG